MKRTYVPSLALALLAGLLTINLATHWIPNWVAWVSAFSACLTEIAVGCWALIRIHNYGGPFKAAVLWLSLWLVLGVALVVSAIHFGVS